MICLKTFPICTDFNEISAYSENAPRCSAYFETGPNNVYINPIFRDMFFLYGHGLDMKKEDKGPVGRSPGKRKEKANLLKGVRRPNRRSIRLPGYDYSRAGAYFVTICVKDRKCLFGDIVERKMEVNDAGRMVDKWYRELENKFPNIKCDKYTIMPNHFHAIIQIAVGADLCVCPNGNGAGYPIDENTAGEHIGSPLHGVIQWFKTMATNEYIRGIKQHGWPPFAGKLWQRNYYEHIIRNENEMARIREYVTNNPDQWATDRENPLAKPIHTHHHHNAVNGKTGMK